MIIIAWAPKEKKAIINGKEYNCHSVYRLMQILQKMNYSTDESYWMREEGDKDEDNSGSHSTGQAK